MHEGGGTRRAVVLTDIEGSTRLLRELGGRYDAVLSRHHALLRQAMVGCGGEVIGVDGDAFLVLFSEPAKALEACVAGQRLLAREPWPADGQVRVRMGVHVGEVRGRGEGFVGLGLHQAARVVPAGHGGQIIATSSLVGAVAGAFPDQIGVVPLGVFHVRDFDGPQELFQVLHPDVDRTFPPLRVPSAGVHNLPPARTSFVGRTAELSELVKATELQSLVSLVGPGGVGKTRLASETGLQVAGRYPSGVWLVPLARVTRPGAVSGQVKTSLGLLDQPGKSSARVICDALKAGPRLIILDNCEHVLDGCVTLVEQLLEHSDSVRVLATSREHLGVDGEVLIRLDPLDLPGDHPGGLVSGGAVELFTARARQARRDFELTAENAATVASICTRLDGIPLALELAAARLSTMSLTQLHRQLDDALRLLESGRRGGETRQRTLRATLAWSHELLTPQDRTVFAGLSIFRGGFTLPAAEAILPAHTDTDADLDVQRSLEQLVAQSMLELNAGTEPPRYRLLEIVRVYAEEHLRAGGSKPALVDAHAGFYADLVHRDADPDVMVTQDALQRTAAEHPNLLAALEHLSSSDQADEHGQLLLDLARFWQVRGHWQLSRQQFLAYLSRPDPGSRSMHGELLGALARVVSDQGDATEARAYWEQALVIARELGERESEGQWLGSLGSVASDLGDYSEARERYEEALIIAREIGDRRHEGYWVGNLGNVSYKVGDHAAARVHFTQALTIARELGDRRAEDVWLGSLGVVASEQGKYDEAREHLERALSISRALGDRPRESSSLSNLGLFAYHVGDDPEAHARWEEALVIARELGARRREGEFLGNLAIVAKRMHDYASARVRFQQALAVARELGDRRSESGHLDSLGTLAYDRADYPEARSRWEESLAIARELGDRRAEEDRIASLGSVDAAVEDYPLARLRFEDALAIARELDNSVNECWRLGELGFVAAAVGDYHESCSLYAQALVLAREFDVQNTGLLDGCARLLAHCGHAVQSTRLLATSDALLESAQESRKAWPKEQYDATVEMCQQQLGAAAAGAVRHSGPLDWDAAAESALQLIAELRASLR